jgi:hypothetical protein
MNDRRSYLKNNNCSSCVLFNLVLLWLRTKSALENKRSTGAELHGMERSWRANVDQLVMRLLSVVDQNRIEVQC